jgi:hypothetical protein
MKTLWLLLLIAATPAIAQVHYAVTATGGKSSTSWHGQLDIQSLALEASRDLTPKWELVGAAAVHNIWQPRSWFGEQFGDGNERVHGASVSLLARRRLGTMFFAEAGTGPLYATKAIPASTSRFNFITQLGAGVTLFRNSNAPVVVGYRFQHISNGGYSPRNPGMNVSAVVVGVRLGTPASRRLARRRLGAAP